MNMITKSNSEQITQMIKEYIIQEIAYEQPDLILSHDFQLVEQGVLDSMGILRVINFMEEEFDIALEPEELMIDNFATIDSITQFLIKKRQ